MFYSSIKSLQSKFLNTERYVSREMCQPKNLHIRPLPCLTEKAKRNLFSPENINGNANTKGHVIAFNLDINYDWGTANSQRRVDNWYW